MIENKYLSDEELEKLILDVEKEKLISAPPDLLENILSSVDVLEEKRLSEISRIETKDAITEISKPPEIVDFAQKKSEFRKYCFRVVSSMAAAIALLILIPGISGIQEREIPSKASVVSEKVRTREEVTGDSKKSIMKTINKSHLFSDMWKFDIFE